MNHILNLLLIHGDTSWRGAFESRTCWSLWSIGKMKLSLKRCWMTLSLRMWSPLIKPWLHLVISSRTFIVVSYHTIGLFAIITKGLQPAIFGNVFKAFALMALNFLTLCSQKSCIVWCRSKQWPLAHVSRSREIFWYIGALRSGSNSRRRFIKNWRTWATSWSFNAWGKNSNDS